MFVCDCMSSPAMTITPDTTFQDALKMIHDHRCRCLPVIDDEGELVGIVSERDLLYVSAVRDSPLRVWEMIHLLSKLPEREIMTQEDITLTMELCAWELAYLLSRLEISEIMTRDVITTTPDTPIEEAARLMVENSIGALPVIDKDNRINGVITETDIIKNLVEYTIGAQSVAQVWRKQG